MQPLAHPDSTSRMPARRAEKYRERLDSLFADIQRLSCEPANLTPELRLEIDALRTRLVELEKEILESDASADQAAGNEIIPPEAVVQPSADQDMRRVSASPILYERERIGFAYTDENLQPVRDTSSLANIPSAITVPLTASGEAIGKVQLAPPPEHAWTPEETDVVNVVAQQVSQQIQSLRLLAETERARAEAESATRRFVHEGWASYLDAIHQNERIGYAYDQNAVAPFPGKYDAGAKPEKVVEESVSVSEEQVGTLYVSSDPAHPLQEDDRVMISAVASRIAQQVESIRLQADSARARAEADELIKRTTRTAWGTFTDQKEAGSLRFAYDTNQVKPFEEKLPQDVSLTLPLLVRGETIGQLAVTGPASISPEDAALANAIATQASLHLETLRLNEELQKRAAELLELDRLKSGFLANMSHELRTPLNSILGFSDVIMEGLDGPLTPNMTTDLMTIQKNGQHLLHLINDVLDMAKIEAGRMNLNPEKFMIHEVLDDVTSITSNLASEKNLALFIEPDSDQTVEIEADRTRLRQVMINVVNNAIKFTEKGSIALRVTRKDENILIRVKDTGIGIPSDKLEVVFQEFVQVDISSTRKAGGTGLGLPISRKLVEMHGGHMWAESTGISGEGTSIFIELPLVARIPEPVEKQAK